MEIFPNKAKNIIVGVFYKPPSMDGDKFVTHFNRMFFRKCLMDQIRTLY